MSDIFGGGGWSGWGSSSSGLFGSPSVYADHQTFSQEMKSGDSVFQSPSSQSISQHSQINTSPTVGSNQRPRFKSDRATGAQRGGDTASKQDATRIVCAPISAIASHSELGGFRIDGKEISAVTVCGWVTAATPLSSRLRLNISDGTGTIAVEYSTISGDFSKDLSVQLCGTLSGHRNTKSSGTTGSGEGACCDGDVDRGVTMDYENQPENVDTESSAVEGEDHEDEGEDQVRKTQNLPAWLTEGKLISCTGPVWKSDDGDLCIAANKVMPVCDPHEYVAWNVIAFCHSMTLLDTCKETFNASSRRMDTPFDDVELPESCDSVTDECEKLILKCILKYGSELRLSEVRMLKEAKTVSDFSETKIFSAITNLEESGLLVSHENMYILAAE